MRSLGGAIRMATDELSRQLLAARRTEGCAPSGWAGTTFARFTVARWRWGINFFYTENPARQALRLSIDY